MQLQFTLQTWTVWPPLTTLNEQDLIKKQNELLSVAPANLRRRLSPLAKTVFYAISQCEHLDTNIPVVFSSAHGELAKSLDLIKLIEAGEEISPTLFSLSVHNAIAGLFSIVFGNTSEITVLAPGEDGIAAAFLEALGILQEGSAEVLIVFYDEPVPDFYPVEPLQSSVDSTCAVALKITRGGVGPIIQFSRSDHCGYEGEQPVQLPLLIQFLSGSNTQLQIKTPRHSWIWQKIDSDTGM